MSRFYIATWLCCFLAAAPLSDASAQLGETPLQRAEQAFVELEYETAAALAQAALESGGHAPSETARLYQLLGTTAAMVGDGDAAYEYYRLQLALDPDAEMDVSLSPALRTHFLRARGWWASRRASLSIRPSLRNPSSGSLRLVVDLADPLELATTIHIHLRAEGGEYTERGVAANDQIVLPLSDLGVPPAVQDQAEAFEYWMSVEDQYGNVLRQLGVADHGERFANPRSAAAGTVEEEPGEPSIAEAWWLWTIVGVVVVGVGVGLGLYFGLTPNYVGRSGFEF